MAFNFSETSPIQVSKRDSSHNRLMFSPKSGVAPVGLELLEEATALVNKQQLDKINDNLSKLFETLCGEDTERST